MLHHPCSFELELADRRSYGFLLNVLINFEILFFLINDRNPLKENKVTPNHDGHSTIF